MRQEYSIVPRYGKKDMTYYVRYFVNNKMIPSQWSTKTGDKEKAKQFFGLNRNCIIDRYLKRKEGKTFYRVMQEYYAKESPYLLIDAARGRRLTETSRKILQGFMINTFVPF